MNSEFPIILFWVLAAAIVFLNLRWSVLSYLLIAQIDMTGVAGLSDLSASRTGIENTVKVIILPCILLWRIGWIRSRHSRWPLAAKIWIGLIIYAAVSTVWTDYRLSALKMIGNLCCYAALATVFTSAWSRRWITEPTLAVVAWCSIGFACSSWKY
jgi:predicted Na+-dependent transporter